MTFTEKLQIRLSQNAPTFFVLAFSVPIINQFKFHYRFCLCLASVHLPYPFHLGLGFQIFGRTVSLRQRPREQFHAVTCRFFNPGTRLLYGYPPINSGLTIILKSTNKGQITASVICPFSVPYSSPSPSRSFSRAFFSMRDT